MNTTKEQQKELDDALVAPENHALKLTPFYNAFEISADVPEIYMQEFWVTVTRHHSSLRFKLDGKSHTVNVDNFRDMLKICPKLPGQKFEEPPLEEDILSFIRDLGHTGEIKFLSDVNVNHMHQLGVFCALFIKCLNGKTTALESLRLSRAQILWGMYHNKQVDYVYLLWEDLVFQVENKNSKKNSDMYYPRFTKVIVDYFMAKDQAIPRRNKMFWHYASDNFCHHLMSPFKNIRIISKRQILLQASKGKRIKTLAKGDKPATTKSKGLTVLSEVALSEAEQMKLATKCRLERNSISSHTSGLGDGVAFWAMFLMSNKQNRTVKERMKKEMRSMTVMMTMMIMHDMNTMFNEIGQRRTESDDEGDDFVHPNLSTYIVDDQEKEKKKKK
ncbi:hypothetical protein Tco_0625150 [Tanacetum coccineum]|uniref:Uncharacterized protein n=1 Tax=Tanacetum coccineum TaxID=301880 RepID=A0ABQ4WG07_9ASTR